jgi:hypothetical protein
LLCPKLFFLENSTLSYLPPILTLLDETPRLFPYLPGLSIGSKVGRKGIIQGIIIRSIGRESMERRVRRVKEGRNITTSEMSLRLVHLVRFGLCSRCNLAYFIQARFTPHDKDVIHVDALKQHEDINGKKTTVLNAEIHRRDDTHKHVHKHSVSFSSWMYNL